jgi:hypothetical protein
MNNRDRMRFKGNVSSQNHCFDTIMNKEYNCFECFLKDSFRWDLSMQGNHYWEVVNKQVKSKSEIRRKDLFLIWFLFFFLVFIFFYVYLTSVVNP